MKKFAITLSAIMLSIPAVAIAQAPSFGLKGGLNMSKFGGDHIVTSDFRTGFTIGAFASLAINSTTAIQPEILYTQKGAKSAAYDYDQFPQDGDAPPVGVYLTDRTSHEYLEIPVLVKLSPSASYDIVQPIFFAGPSVAFLLSTDEALGQDYEEYLNKTDFGLVIGGGLEYGRFVLDARYNFGFSNIDKDYDLSFGTVEGGVRNRGFRVMAGFRAF